MYDSWWLQRSTRSQVKPEWEGTLPGSARESPGRPPVIFFYEFSMIFFNARAGAGELAGVLPGHPREIFMKYHGNLHFPGVLPVQSPGGSPVTFL